MYVTVYVPGVLVDGVIPPVEEFKDKPDAELYVPPEVPLNVGACADETDVQYGEPG